MEKLINKIDQQKIDNGSFKINKGQLQFGILQIINQKIERAKIDNIFLKRGREFHEKIENEIINNIETTTFSSTFVASLGLEKIEIEKYVNKSLNDFSISGIADFVGEKDGTTFLFDFKTGQKYSSHYLQIGGYIYLLDLDPKTVMCGVIYEDLEEVMRVDPVNALEGFLIALREFEGCLKSYETFLDLKESQESSILELVVLKHFYQQLDKRIEEAEILLKNEMKDKNITDIKIFNTLISIKKRKGYDRISLDTTKVTEFLKDSGVYQDFVKKTIIRESESLSFKNI